MLAMSTFLQYGFYSSLSKYSELRVFPNLRAKVVLRGVLISYFMELRKLINAQPMGVFKRGHDATLNIKSPQFDFIPDGKYLVCISLSVSFLKVLLQALTK